MTARYGAQLDGKFAKPAGAFGEAGAVQMLGRRFEFSQLLGGDVDELPQGGRLKTPVDVPVGGLHGLQRPEDGLDGIAHPLRRASADGELVLDVGDAQSAPHPLEANG